MIAATTAKNLVDILGFVVTGPRFLAKNHDYGKRIPARTTQ